MAIQTIVTGMDFSDAAVEAATWTARVFAPSAELVLVHAIEAPDRPGFLRRPPAPPEVVERMARDFAATRFRELGAFLSDRAPRTEVRLGKPAEVIPALVRETRADLVVIGPHGGRPHPAKFLGSTADRIVRLSSVPVLVATQPREAPRTILTAVDDASITPTVLEWVSELAQTFDADVTLLHVLSNAVYSHVASASYATAGSEERAREEIRTTLEEEGTRWLEAIARTGLRREHVTAKVTYGHAGDTTVEMASAIGANLVVVGRRGSGLVAPALLGSTVGTVLHGARCPVFVVTEDRDAGESAQ